MATTKEVPYDRIKTRAEEIVADMKKSHDKMDDAAKQSDPAANITVEEVVLMLIHSHRDNNVEVKFGMPAANETEDLNFAAAKPGDLTSTQVLKVASN